MGVPYVDNSLCGLLEADYLSESVCPKSELAACAALSDGPLTPIIAHLDQFVGASRVHHPSVHSEELQ